MCCNGEPVQYGCHAWSWGTIFSTIDCPGGGGTECFAADSLGGPVNV